MIKYKFFTNFEKEEKWLNEMAQQGYRFVGKSMGYKFVPAEPEGAIIKIDFRKFAKKDDFEDYLALFEDSGWEHVSGTRSSGYQYFRKIDDKGDEDIFSDADSKAARYKRLSEMCLSVAYSFVPILAVFYSTDLIDPTVFANPKSLYLTPGLWQKTGTEFWRAFLFETPFALFRGFLWVTIPAMIIMYLAFGYKADQQYKKTREN